MSKVIDEKVVEMRFDNKQFEQGAKETMTTLEKLKTALNFSKSGESLTALEKAANNTDFSGMAKGIQALQDRFSTLGIVGMRVIENITDSLMGMVSKGINFVTDSIVSGGIKRAMNIENAHFQLQSLLKDEEKVQSIMDSANKSVDGTAYSYDVAAKAGSMFAASGVEAGEKMDKALAAIANTTAAVNGDYESMSMIFTQVSGQGRLMGDQLLQLSTRGMNAAALLVKYFQEVRGQAGMTEGTIRDMVSKGQIDFETFVDAMNYAYDGAAKRANETFTGAYSNIKAALSRIGALFVSPLIEQNGPLVDMFNAIRVQINNVKKDIEPIAPIFTDTVKMMASAVTGSLTPSWDKMITKIKEAGGSADEFEESLKKALSSHDIDPEKLITKYGSLSEAFNKGAFSVDILKEALGNLKSPMKETLEISEELSKGMSGDDVTKVQTALKDLGFELGEVDGKFGSMTESAIKAFQAANNINETGIIDEATLAKLNEAIGGVEELDLDVEDLASTAAKGQNQVASTFHNFSNVLIPQWDKMITKIKEAGGSADEFEESLKKALSSHDIDPEKLITKYGSLSEAFNKGAFSVDILKEALGNLKSPMKETLEISEELSKGMSGDDVTKVQTALKDLGFELGEVDGKFGSMTESAIKAFQAANNINETGIIDEATLAKLNEAIGGVEELDLDVEDLVKDIQKPSGKELLLDSLANAGKGLLSVLNPIRNAFANVFPPKTESQIYGIIEKINEFSKKLILSSESSNKLERAITGVLSIVKLFGTGMSKLFGLFTKGLGPVGSFSDLVLTLAANLGDGLTMFSNWVSESTLLSKVYHGMEAAIGGVSNKVKDFISIVKDYAKILWDMSGIEDMFISLGKSIDNLDPKDVFNKLKAGFDKVRSSLVEIAPDFVVKAFDDFIDLMTRIGSTLDDINWKNPKEAILQLKDALKKLIEAVHENPGLDGFIQNVKNFVENLKENFTFDRLFDNIDTFKDKVGGFITWIKENLGPAFSDVSFGSLLGTGGAIAVIHELLKLVKSFNSGDGVGEAFTGMLNSVKGALSAWQKDLKADQIKKIAEAILILSGALVLLSFADMEQLIPAAAILTSVATSLGFAFSKFESTLGRWNSVDRALTKFSSGLSRSMKKLATAVEIRAIGKSVKDFATAMVEIVLAIVGVAIMYEKYPDSMDKAVKLVAGIAAGLIVMVTAMSILGKKLDGGMSEFKKAASGALMLCAGVLLVVNSLAKLMAITIPPDYGIKLGILAGIFVGMGVLAMAVGAAAKISGGNSTKQAATILSLCVMLYTTVKAVEKLFSIELPSDYGIKLGILAGIFVALGGVIIAVGYASKLAGGKLKAAGTILAMCAFLAVAVGSLAVLTLLPGDKMLKGATSLGLVLVTLGVALAGAGKITTKDTWKSVLSMAITTATIAASLAILSMINGPKLLIGATALGAILGILAVDLNYASKVSDKESVAVILAMCASVGVIALSLNVLAQNDWASLTAAGVALGGTLLAMAYALKVGSDVDPDISALGAFAAGLAALITIAVSINELAQNPWERLLAAGASLSATLLALAAAMKIASSCNPNLTAIGMLIAATASLGVIAFSLYQLAHNCDPQNLITAAIALGALLLELSVVMAVCGVIGNLGPAAFIGIAALDVLLISLLAILGVVGEISDKVNFAGGVVVFKQLGEAIGGFGGAIISGLGGGIAEAITKIGESLSDFAEKSRPFFNAISEFGTSENVTAAGMLAACILALTVAELINGVVSFISQGNAMAKLGSELSDFAANAEPFFGAIANLNPDSATAAKTLADMILTMTKAELISGVSSFVSNLLGGGKSLSDFGEELAAFAEPIVQYAQKVQNVDFSAVEGSARAAQILMGLYDGLPKTGGWMQKITGETGSLKNFGEELKAFAEPLVQYAQKVAGVDFSAVEGSANAAKIMMDLYTGLPKTGGWMQVIMGEQKTLSQFGQELAAFGPYMASYVESIAGIGPDSVQASADAAQILIDLSNNLGSNNTLWENIFGGGKQSLTQFGEELVAFGTSLSNYSNSIAAISTEKMAAVTSELQKLVTFATSVSGLDTSGMTGFVAALETMGNTGVEKFVAAFTNSTSTVTNAITSMLNSALTAIASKNGEFLTKGTASATQYLTGIKNKYGEAQTTGMQMATKALAGLQQQVSQFLVKGTASATQYLTGIKNKYGEAQTTGSTLASKVLAGLTSKNGEFLTKGAAHAMQYLTGIKNKYGEAQTTGRTFAEKVLAGLHSKLGEFLTEGAAAANNYLTGFKNKYGEAQTAGKTMATNLIAGLKSYNDQFAQAGRDGAQGFINGFISDEMRRKAADAGRQLAKAAYDAAKKELDEHSPSRKMGEVGEFAALGFINKLMAYVSKAYSAGTEIGSSTLDGLRSAVNNINTIIDSGIDINPRIVPTVDLSNVRKSTSDISKLFNEAIGVTVGNVQTTASAIRNKKVSEDDVNRQKNTGSMPNQQFTFNQNNYSPKALSRIEIYRDGKNLFSQFKQEVEAT